MKKLKENNDENYDFVLKQKVVEALIFSSSIPITYNELLKRIIDKNTLNEILENLQKKYFANKKSFNNRALYSLCCFCDWSSFYQPCNFINKRSLQS